MNPAAGHPVQPFHFGSPQRRLFGLFHASTASLTRPAVLICNAFGQEAIRAHRMLRVLAERLAREGHPVLRFDYFGTGDSMGEDRDGDLAGWTEDVLQADRELCARSQSRRTVWVGMRLGATVALRAACRAPEGLLRLVLWDAVLDGARYLDYLRDRHIASLDYAFSLKTRPTARERAQDASLFRDEAIGFALSHALREQIGALSVASLTWPPAPVSTVALTDPDSADGRDLTAALAREATRVHAVVVRHGTDWTLDSAENSALVPASALMALMQQVGVV